MKEIVATLSQKGQVTVPVEVRRLLGLKPKDKVAFAVAEGQVKLVPAKSTLEAAYGAVKPLKRPENFKELRRMAQEEHAEKTLAQMQE